MRVEYSSNNSGGYWWLKDEHWLALEAAGWEVSWGGEYFCHSKNAFFNPRPANKPEPCDAEDKCPGHKRFDSLDELNASGTEKFLDASATTAYKEFDTLADAIIDWEEATGMDASDAGCSCCGCPHTFRGGSEYLSGSDCAFAVEGIRPMSVRQMARMLGKKKKNR